jgi:uncharacterized cupin superfamily protein
MTAPRLIPRADAERVVWGSEETGLVPDIIYLSDEQLHVIEFSMERGARFVHSPEKRTVFGADEVFHTVAGNLLLANPETGEVHPVPKGHSAFFRRDTWHHGFAHRGPVRVIEFMAPPPALGTTQPYARARPYLETWKYEDTGWEGKWPMDRAKLRPSFTVLAPQDRLWSLGDPRGMFLRGLVASTEHLTVYVADLEGDHWTAPDSYRGTAVAVVIEGSLSVDGSDETVTAEAGDAIVLAAGHEYSYKSDNAHFMLGIGHSPVSL